MSTDQSSGKSREDTYVGFEMADPEEKQRVRVRAAQLGYSSMAAYVRSLVREDLDDADSSI